MDIEQKKEVKVKKITEPRKQYIIAINCTVGTKNPKSYNRNDKVMLTKAQSLNYKSNNLIK